MLRISSGLFAHMVLQRTRTGVCDARVAGTGPCDGRVTCRVTHRGRPIRGFRRVPVGRVVRGRFTGRLKGLPTGGPYDLRLELRDRADRERAALVVPDVWVGDVWILAGQSNMLGQGFLKDAARPHPAVRAFYMDDRWAVARDPIHNLWDAADPVHHALHGRIAKPSPLVQGTGPGVAFGREMFRRTRVPQGLVACAHGGTSLAQWDPALGRNGGHSLYGALLRRLRINGGRAAGVLWYQGCNDAGPETAPRYGRALARLIRALRKDARSPRLPWVVVQIATNAGAYSDGTAWNRVQEEQRRLPERAARCAVVPAVDLELDDLVHIGGRAQQRLGKRLAQAMRALRGEPGAGPPPIELQSFRIARHPVTGQRTTLAVRFRHVAGRLRAAGRPAGFSLTSAGSRAAVYRVELCGAAARVYTTQDLDTADGLALSYGYGTAPHCTVTDAADRSLPAFGPIPFGPPARPPPRQAVTACVQRLLVSRAFRAPRDIRALPYPRARDRLGFTEREFSGGTCSLHKDLFASRHRTVLAYFRCHVDCCEPMRLGLGLGYDGPLKVWWNGRALFCDAQGTNPIGTDKRVILVSATPGKHECLLALLSNAGRAYGLRLRFWRQDVTPRQLERGTVRMPGVLVQ